jgi:hypothetical protein
MSSKTFLYESFPMTPRYGNTGVLCMYKVQQLHRCNRKYVEITDEAW